MGLVWPRTIKPHQGTVIIIIIIILSVHMAVNPAAENKVYIYIYIHLIHLIYKCSRNSQSDYVVYYIIWSPRRYKGNHTIIKIYEREKDDVSLDKFAATAAVAPSPLCP